MGPLQEFERDQFVASKRPQILASIAMSIGAFGVGTVCAWSGPALEDLVKSEDLGELSTTEKSWCASIVPLGALVAGPFSGFLVDRFGRRMTTMIASIIFFWAWLTIAFAPNILVLIVGRFITGLCMGAVSVAIPMYLAEVTEEKIRGALCNLFPLMAGLGILNTYILGSLLTWFWLSLANAVVPLSLFCLAYFLPESPIFLLSKGRMEKARRALKWFRGAASSDQVEPELQQFRRGIDERKDIKLSAKEFFSPSVFKPNMICLSIMFFQQMSGINAIIFYTVQIFKSAGVNPSFSSIIVGIVLLISITASVFLIDIAGRKMLLLVSGGGMALGHVGLGVFFYLKEEATLAAGQTISYCNMSSGQNETLAASVAEIVPEGLSWLPLASLVLFVLAFNLGYGPVPLLYLGELLPAHVKGFGAGIATAFTWLMAFLVVKSFEDFICYLGQYGVFWTFGIFSVLGFVFCSLFVPETKGKTLDEIQQLFR